MQELVIPSECLIVEHDEGKAPFSEDSCQELARSIKNDGLHHPPVVRPEDGQPGPPALVAGGSFSPSRTEGISGRTHFRRSGHRLGDAGRLYRHQPPQTGSLAP
jgi:hypothetical protein